MFSWYKYLIVDLVFSYLGFWSRNPFLIAPLPDRCLLVPFQLYVLTPGANLTYLTTPSPRQFFMGAKSFIVTQEMKRMFVLKEKLACTMRKCMVSMATVNVILKYGGVHTKLVISPLLLILDH